MTVMFKSHTQGTNKNAIRKVPNPHINLPTSLLILIFTDNTVIT